MRLEDLTLLTPAKTPGDTQWFRHDRFGMFIHWGLYSQLGKGEWIQHIGGIPKEEYVKLQDTFTASKFDGHKIARVAKKAGA